MEQLALIATVAIIHLLALISPGPDFFVTVKNSLSYSRRTGIFTAIGVGLGIGVHLLYCIAGLAILISKSIIAFNMLKYIGAGYLIYLGVKSIMARAEGVEIKRKEKKKDIARFSASREGFLTNVLNPKATVYFLSLFTLVLSPEMPSVTLAILSAIMIAMTALWFCLVAVFFTQKKVVSVYSRSQSLFNKAFGGILIALGIKMVLVRDK